MVEFRNFKTFNAVAEHLNITKATEEMNYSQPGITLQIRVLEKEIGSPLFTRVGKQLFLRPTGKVLKHHTERLLTVLNELEGDLRKIEHLHGTLVIAAPEFYCSNDLPSILSTFVRKHAHVKVKLISCNSIEVTNLVRSNKVDIGIIAGMSEFPEVDNTIIDSEEVYLVASPKIVNGQDVSSILNQHPFLLDTNVSSFVYSFLPEIKYTPQLMIECTSQTAIKQAVLNQAGVCTLGEREIANELMSGELKVLHTFSKKLETSLIFLKSRSEETAIRTFSNLVKDGWKVKENA